MSNYRAQMFFYESLDHLGNASTLLGRQFDTALTPYNKAEYHAASVLYPLCHATKMLVRAGRMIKGSFLMLHALVNDPATAVPHLIGGLFCELGAMIFDAINVLASAVSLITRTLSTLFNFGYMDDVINRAGQSLHGREMGGRNAETMVNMFAGMGLGLASMHSETVDSSIYNSTANVFD